MANNADTLQRVYDNYCRVWLMCVEIIANPTQAAIDKLTSTAEGTGVVRPKITYSEDGANYDWLAYQQALGAIMDSVRTQMIRAAGPYEIQSRAVI